MSERGLQTIGAVVALALVVVVVYFVLGALGGQAPQPMQGPTAAPTVVATSPISPTPAPRLAPTTTLPTTVAPASPTPGPAKTGIVRTDTQPTGDFKKSSLTLPPERQAQKTNRYIVKVETAVNLDVNEAAKQIHKVLQDDRGWVGYGKNSFQLVATESEAQFSILLASAKTVDKLCAPLSTHGTWNCRNGNNVVLNTDRWLYKTPTYLNLDEYRAYMVNHEVGHYIGLGHVTCPKPGGLAPVMMQQSIDLGGCRPNPWPRQSA